MAKIAFFLYVGCVLMFSAFARADVLAMPFTTLNASTPNAHITEVGLDEVNLNLYFAGWVATPCQGTPKAEIKADLENPSKLILRLLSPSPTRDCYAKTQEFETVVNLPVVAQNSGLRFDSKSIYEVKIEGYPFVMNVVGRELLRVPGFIAQ